MGSRLFKVIILFIILTTILPIELLAQTNLILPDLIPYRKGLKWGYCNPQKEIVIDCRYDFTEPFKNGYAKVTKSGKIGLIDSTGREIIPCEFDNVTKYNWKDIIITESN